MTDLIRDAARPFTGDALTALLKPAVRLLGLGEPTHGVEAFTELRNELFRHLVEHDGYRSFALESDCLAALIVDAYVTGGEGTVDDVTHRGLSHGFGDSPANRELVRWMRAYNESRPEDEWLRFYGVDGPLEMTGAAAPNEALLALHDYLTAAHLEPPCGRETFERVDERWTDPDALRDPARSIGRTPEANALRLLTDDLSILLTAHAPHLAATTSPGERWRAGLHARTAAGLLRYHAAMADSGPARLATVMYLRDTMMADNLDAIVRHEARRGPTLVSAHNSHLQREQSTMRFGGQLQRWWSAGAIVGTSLGEGYAVAATTFGSQGADVPDPGSLEGLLSAQPHARAVLDPRRLAGGAGHRRIPADYTYAALDPDTVAQFDAIVFVKEIPARI